MFTSQRRKFNIPGLKRKAPDGDAPAAFKPPSVAAPAAALPSAAAEGPGPDQPSSNAPAASDSIASSGKENVCPAEEQLQQPPAAKAPKLGLGASAGRFRPPSLLQPPQQQRQPLLPAPQPKVAARSAGAEAGSTAAPAGSRFFTVLYTKRDKFKKKSGKNYADGLVELKADGQCCLYDMDGKQVTRGKVKAPAVLESGSILELGGYVAEYDRHVSEEEFREGKCFVEASTLAAAPSAAALKPQTKFALPTGAAPFSSVRPTTGKNPAGGAAGAGGPSTPAAPPPLFDPRGPDAVVLNLAQWAEGAGKLPSGRPVVPVVVDPYIARSLRPHQKEGVRFMYECVTGLRSPSHTGCILADAMGLGKTLQVIALLWTLLRQGPAGPPLVRKAIVVTPSSLTNNWGKEVTKWLGSERLRAMVLTQGPNAAQQVADFKLGSVWKLLIGSYEALRKHGADLAGTADLLVCDEGHRLKAAGGNKTIAALLALGCGRRVVLTGTPVQNNMEEFYALLSFATPGLLGPPATFKKVYGDVITRSRDKDATPADRELGEARAA